MANKKDKSKKKIVSKSKAPKRAVAKKRSTAKPKVVERNPLAFLNFYPAPDADEGLYKKLFFGLAGSIFIIMMLLAPSIGISADDKMQNEYEQKLMAYYESGDRTALEMKKTKMHLYGGMFEVLTGYTNKMLGSSSPDQAQYHKVRHIWNAIFGFIAMLFIGFLARDIAGWRAALIALLFIFLSPRFFGHSLMNPKDIPFATGYIVSIYFMIRLFRQLPKPSWKTLLGLTLGIGLAVGVRAGGLIVVFYMGLFAGLDFLGKYGFRGLVKEGPTMLKYLAYTTLPALGGVIIAIMFWPYAMANPVKNILNSLAELTKYGVDIRLLFNSQMLYAKNLPWTYLPVWVTYTVPLFFLIGLILYLVFSVKIFKKYARIPMMMLIFAFIFPFVYVIFQGSTLYDGWRHLIFPYTAGIVLTALAFNYLLNNFQTKKPVFYGIAAVIALTALEPAIFMVKNSKFTYTYFNPLIGGSTGAFGKFESDYWGTSVKQGIEWLEDQGILHANMTEQVIIGTNFDYTANRYVKEKYGDKVKVNYCRFRQRLDWPWDYGLFATRFMDASHLKAGTWPPKNTVHKIKSNNSTLLCVLKNVDRSGYEGMRANKDAAKAKQEDKPKLFSLAIEKLNAELKNNPDNEVAWVGLANAYMNLGDIETAKACSEKAMEIEPQNIAAYNYLGLYHLRKGQIGEAKKKYLEALKIQPKYAVGHFYLGKIYEQEGNLDKALEYALNSRTYNPKFKASYEMIVKLYEKMGNPSEAERYRKAITRLK